MNHTDPLLADSSTTRRDFGKALVLLATMSPAVAAAGPPEQDDAKHKETLLSPVQALTELTRSKYGQYLTKEQIEQIVKAVERIQFVSDGLRKIHLENGDEPCFIFRA
jgi:hypothetical protein